MTLSCQLSSKFIRANTGNMFLGSHSSLSSKLGLYWDSTVHPIYHLWEAQLCVFLSHANRVHGQFAAGESQNLPCSAHVQNHGLDRFVADTTGTLCAFVVHGISNWSCGYVQFRRMWWWVSWLTKLIVSCKKSHSKSFSFWFFVCTWVEHFSSHISWRIKPCFFTLASIVGWTGCVCLVVCHRLKSSNIINWLIMHRILGLHDSSSQGFT